MKTIWLSQKLMAELFDVSVPTINEHLKNIFSRDELVEISAIRNFLITATDGKNYTTKHYNKDAPTTRNFFAKVQNKLHFAIHGHTAAELIHRRADANQPQMGLTTWDKTPDGKTLKTDVATAKKLPR